MSFNKVVMNSGEHMDRDCKTGNNRESGIELLRVLTMCGVIILHYNNGDIGGGFNYVKPGSLNYYFLYWIESLCACAVNLFMLISGYFLCMTQKRKIIKPIELIVEVMIFEVLMYLVTALIGVHPVTVQGLILSIVPDNYFVILYIAVYIISPYLNLVLRKLSPYQWKKFMITIIVLFSVWPTFVDLTGEVMKSEWIGLSTIGMYGSQWGYTVVNFILLYIVGAYLRLHGIGKENDNIKTLLISLLLCTVILTKWSLLYVSSAREYCNPLIIIEAVVIFLLFRKIHFDSKVVNSLAQSAFTCFILQNYILGSIKAGDAVQKSFYFMILHLLISVSCIYGICWVTFVIYNFMTSSLFKNLERFFSRKQIDFSLDEEI